ncbi:MAG: ATP-binding protein [Betaproteobacteria bacterium]
MKALSAIPKHIHAAWPTASLRTYLVVAILLATVPIAALMSYQIFDDVNGQLGRMKINLKKNAASLAQGVEREIASSIDALTILSYAESIQHHDIDRFERALTVLPLLRPSWSGAYLVDMDGAVLFDTETPGGRTHKNFKSGEDFQRVLANREAVVSNLLLDGAQGKYVTTIQVPVMIDGHIRYVLGARINASVWQDLLEKTGVPANGFTSLVDRDHRVIARTMSPERFLGHRMPPSIVALVGDRESGVARMELLEGGTTYAAWDTVPTAHWNVGAGIPADPLDAGHNKAIAGALATALSCLALGIFLALFVARRLTKPLHQLARNDLSRPYERIAVREIALLRDALLAAQAQDEVARARLQTKRDELQRKADEFETLFDNSPIGLAFAQDSQCRVVLHNAAMDTLFGPPEAYGDSSVQVMHRGQRLDPVDQPLQRAAAEGARIKGMELELVIGGRQPIFVLVNAVPLRDAGGRPRGAIGAVVDITERKLAEARLIRAEQRLRESQHLVDLAQEAGHVGFFHYHFEGDALTWTAGQAALFGLETMELQGKLSNWLQRIDSADSERIEKALKQIIAARQEKETFDFRVVLPESAERWLSSRVLISYGDDGAPLYMIGVTVDMTDQKEAERQRAALIEREQTARREAEAANRAKDEFLAMLGHELRNPLSAISSAVEVLNRVDAASEIATNARAIIGRQTLHLAHMMDDLLDVARVISGKVLLSRHPMDLSNLVRRVVATQEITGDASRHKLVLALDEAWIDADAVRMEQVVSNLLTNALKYTPSGGRISVLVKREGDEAVLEVKDNGIGISPALLPRIFDLFVQGERTLDRRAGGLGIGLTLVRRLVNLHGGNIVAESSSEGSTFRVRIPAIDPLLVPQEPAGALLSNRRQVAVIEDNQDALESLRSILECDGHTVVFTAVNGREGLSRLLETRPEVAIVDIGLPGLTGYEVAKRARAAGFAGRLVALSGYGQQRDIQQAMAAGFDAHFVKPVKTDQLRAMLTEN